MTEEWDTAINSIVCRNGGTVQWMVGAAAKWKIDETSTFRCKFNSDLQLGMSLQQKLDDNVMLTLSFNIDCINPLRGGHKVGLAFDIEGWANESGISNFLFYKKMLFDVFDFFSPLVSRLYTYIYIHIILWLLWY